MSAAPCSNCDCECPPASASLRRPAPSPACKLRRPAGHRLACPRCAASAALCLRHSVTPVAGASTKALLGWGLPAPNQQRLEAARKLGQRPRRDSHLARPSCVLIRAIRRRARPSARRVSDQRRARAAADGAAAQSSAKQSKAGCRRAIASSEGGLCSPSISDGRHAFARDLRLNYRPGRLL